jgi:putative ABC transport system substrate-binding protein
MRATQNDLPQKVQAMMDRRVFAGLAVTALLGLPVIAMAQEMGKVSRIGALLPWIGPTPGDFAYLESERPRLRALGWVEGQNLFVERRWAGIDPTRYRQVAAELKALKVALIITTGAPAIRAARDGAPGVPIVMVNAGDPVASGFANSLAHPGGDLTGTSAAGDEIIVKQLSLLLRVAPHAKKVTVLISATRHENDLSKDLLTAAAKSSDVKIELIYVTRVEELDAAVARAIDGVLLVIPDPMFGPHFEHIAEQAIRAKVPAALPALRFVRAGGLMSFIAPEMWHWEKSASYWDKILRGAKPADLPIEQPTQFELAINLKTARALGLTIPQSVLLLADEVIQ